MSRMSSTFGRQSGLKSSQKSLGGNYLTDAARTRSPSPLRRSGSNSSLRRSTGNLAASLNMSGRKSADLQNIESEYIKNLQQQVYFLELEANYLREQARKATDMHPQMTAEAERMLGKLRHLQEEVDGLNIENRRKEGDIGMLSVEKTRALETLSAEEAKFNREKRLLMDEIVQLKKDNEMMSLENIRKDTELSNARSDVESTRHALRNAEGKIDLLRNQLDQRIEQHKITQLALEEKRAEVLRTETNLRELEDKYYSSTVQLKDKAMQDLRDEIRMLRQKLKETEMMADQDRFLKNKLSDDSSHLVKENALINQQVLELQKQLDRERELREATDTRRSVNAVELAASKDRESKLQFELNNTKEQLRQEQDRVRHYMDQLSAQGSTLTSTELNASSTRSRLVELESVHRSTEDENAQLRRDKALLTDHTADLQRQLQEKEAEILRLHASVTSLGQQLNELEHIKNIDSAYQSRKWQEFEQLADSMRNMSHTLATVTSPRSARRTGLKEY
ncbi:paramyosin isoform X2 [Lingula anatina]|uniref:Paramyosin isoform X2 n=1 Tax=Lingula anatina TaxID=7574 RepID=A0A1S3H9T4_LINAN|nr:paramyosin isoform X2 [Lingula anatina]|eukprot:XP_013381884.1 paramyosin isoform X2 [Lingula anatina]